MTVNDKMAKVKQDIGSVEDTERQQKFKKAEQISEAIQKNLGEDDLSPHTTLGFAKQIAASSTSGLKKWGLLLLRWASSHHHHHLAGQGHQEIQLCCMGMGVVKRIFIH